MMLHLVVYKSHEGGSWVAAHRIFDDKEKATDYANGLQATKISFQWLVISFNPEVLQ